MSYRHETMEEVFDCGHSIGIGHSVTNEATGARARHAFRMIRSEWDKKTDIEKHELRKELKKRASELMREQEEKK